MEILPATIDDMLAAPNWWALLDEYAAECGNTGIGVPDMQVDQYRALESVGFLKILSAHDSGELVGFLFYILTVLPHYGKPVAVSESFFVAAAYRSTGAGLGLLKAAEAAALDAGAVGLLMSAPSGGPLDKLLAAKRYTHTNNAWFKRLGAMAEPIKSLPAMTCEAVDVAYAVEERMLGMPQVELSVSHALHAGMYHRTITIPAGVAITGALIRVATLLVVNGDCEVFTGNEVATLEGHHVLQCQPHRKQVFLAHSDTHLTMIFPTAAETVEEAENEFTGEADRLQSRHKEHA